MWNEAAVSRAARSTDRKLSLDFHPSSPISFFFPIHQVSHFPPSSSPPSSFPLWLTWCTCPVLRGALKSVGVPTDPAGTACFAQQHEQLKHSLQLC